MATKTLDANKIQCTLKVDNYNSWNSSTLGRVFAGKVNVQWEGSKTVRSASRITYIWPNGVEDCSKMVVYIPFHSQSSPGRCTAYLTTKNIAYNKVVDSDWIGPSSELSSGYIARSGTPYSDSDCTKALSDGTWYGSGSDNTSVKGVYFPFTIGKMSSGTTYYVYIIQDTDSTCSFYGGTTAKATITYTDTPKYSISYNSNGGSPTPASQTKIHGTALTLASSISRGDTTSKVTTTFNAIGGSVSPVSTSSVVTTRYTFDKWKATDGTTYSAGGSYTKNEATTLTATWTESKTGADVTFPTPTRTGFTFNGWKNLAGQIYNNYTPIASTTLYADWTVNHHTVKFDPNGGKFASGVSTARSVQYGTQYQKVRVGVNTFEITPLPKPTKTGYTFAGWKYGSNIITEETKMLTDSDHTLVAQWTANTYRLTFNANGGKNTPGENFSVTNPPTGYGDGETTSFVTVIYDATVFNIMSSNIPTRFGYVFLGWYSNTEDDGICVYNELGRAIGDGIYWDNNKNWIHNGDTILYAKWKPLSVIINYRLYNDVTALIYRPIESMDEMLSVEDVFGGKIRYHHRAIGWYVKSRSDNGSYAWVKISKAEDWNKVLENVYTVSGLEYGVCDVYAKVEPRFKILYIDSNGQVKKLGITTPINKKYVRIYPYID